MKKLFLSLIVLTMTLTATAARPYFVGHRGSRWGVENTKEAFEQGCIRGQFDYLETDIKVTKDKVFICWHDDNTSKYGEKNKTIASTDWSVLKEIKHTQKRGSKTYTGYLCSMDEYLDICKKYNKRPVIELKWATGINSNDQSNMEKLVQAIKAKGFYETCIILTSMKPCLQWLHDKHPKMKLQFLTGEYWNSHFDWCVARGIDVDIQSGTWLTKSTVTKYHNKGLKVNMWTINSVSAYNKHKEMDCDFVTTDYLEPSDFGWTAWEKKAFPDGTYTATGEAGDGGNTGSGTTTPDPTPDPTKSLTVTPTTDITLSGTIGQTTAAPSVTLTVKGTNLTTNISANASTGAVTLTKSSDWNDLTGGNLTVALDLNFEKGAGEYTGYVAIQSTSSYRTQINIKATLKAGEGTVTPPVVEPEEPEEPVQPSTPLAGTHSMSDALWAKAGSTYSFAEKANRSISYYNNELYIPQSDKGSFVVVDPATGNVKQTYTIGTPSFLQHNLRITSDGQMMLGNTNMGETSVAQVYVYTSSLQGSEEMSPIGTAAIGARSDYFHIYGSWAKGGNLLALANTGNKVIQIPFTGGSTASEIEIHHADIPTGTSAIAIPSADGKSFYASVSGSIPTKHKMATGEKEDAFTGTDKPTAVNASGLGVFHLHGHTYMVTPASATSGKFDLFDITEGLSQAKLLYTKDPQLGETKNNAMTVDFCTHISGNDAFIYIIAPNNGVAAYKFTFTPEAGSVTPPATEQTTPDVTYGNVKFFLQGGTLNVPESNEALWNSMWTEFKAKYNMIDYSASGFVTPLFSQSGTGYDKSGNHNEASIGRFLQNCFYTSTDPKYTAISAASANAPWGTGEIWEWLSSYFTTVNPSMEQKALNYSYETQSFLQNTASLGTYGVTDWTEAGKPEAWSAAYMFGHKPTKTDDVFLGWYDNAYANGSPLTKLPTSGNVYACWKNSPVSTDIESVEATNARVCRTATGVEVLFEGTKQVIVYNINGMMVAGGIATDYYTCDLEAGMYIVRVGNQAYKFVK